MQYLSVITYILMRVLYVSFNSFSVLYCQRSMFNIFESLLNSATSLVSQTSKIRKDSTSKVE